MHPFNPTDAVSDVRLTLYADVSLTKAHEYVGRFQAVVQRCVWVVHDSAKELKGVERLVVVQMRLSSGRTLSGLGS